MSDRTKDRIVLMVTLTLCLFMVWAAYGTGVRHGLKTAPEHYAFKALQLEDDARFWTEMRRAEALDAAECRAIFGPRLELLPPQ